MNRLTAVMVLMAPVILMLSGCVTANVTGNEIGGTIPMMDLTRKDAVELAESHCARYGRSSHILAFQSEDSKQAVFECKPS